MEIFTSTENYSEEMFSFQSEQSNFFLNFRHAVKEQKSITKLATYDKYVVNLVIND